MSEQGKRYAKIGDFVIHKRTGEMGRIVEVHPPNSYKIADRAVSCPVVVSEANSVFLDVPGKTMFEFLPNDVVPAVEAFRCVFDVGISDAINTFVTTHGVDKQVAMAIVGSVIRERLRKEI